MALVTLQRSPSPSNDPDEESAEGGDEGDGRSALRPKSLSESYFTVKGAALILPHSDLNRKTSRKNHGGEIQRHLQSMLYLLRPEDRIKVAIRLENPRSETVHSYMALVSTTGRQDTEEFVILGLDCTSTASASPSPSPSSSLPPSSPPSSPGSGGGGSGGGAASLTAGPMLGGGVPLATIGLVLPIWMGLKVHLSGDGGFSIYMDEKSFLFKPVSVQAMWSAIQSVDRAVHQADAMKYMAEGLTHTWVDYYRCKVDTSNKSRLTAWNTMEDVTIFAPKSYSYTNENETEKLKLMISGKLKEVMVSVDLDEATSRSLRMEVERGLNMKLDGHKEYFDEELIRILGQLDAPSKILDFLYLGSEWNASNLEELQNLGIKYILNVTREIDNFFQGMLKYCNVRLYDVESSDLLKHWLKTYKFICHARLKGSKVLVHCKMGVSRSASTVMAFLMKENRWPLEQAFDFVKERRSCVRPNKGFMEQLRTYEGILNASNKRDIFRTKSQQDMLEGGEEGEGESGQQGTFLGESLFRVMQGSEGPLSLHEEILLRKNYSSDFTSMEPDFETDSRSADSMEESVPDVPSPLAEQPPSPFLLTAVDLPSSSRPGDDVGALPGNQGGGQLAVTGDGPSRIKADSSWIKLEAIGETSTDLAEAMEVEESGDGTTTTTAAGEATPWAVAADPAPTVISSSSPPVVKFRMGSEGGESEGTASPPPPLPSTSPHPHSHHPPPPKIILEGATSGESSDDAVWAEQQGKGGPPPGGDFDMGVHQYYSREQIPWDHGKVRDLRKEFCEETASASSAVSGKASSRREEDEAEEECERSLLEAVSKVQEAPLVVSQCDSCVELSALGEEEGEEGLQSLYEREEIPLTPGTVQRTRQEIEQRQKQFGEGCDQAMYGMKPIRRTASLRDDKRPRDGSRGRHSERRKTCTPIVSPPPESETAFSGMEQDHLPPDLDIKAAVLRLDFEAKHIGGGGGREGVLGGGGGRGVLGGGGGREGVGVLGGGREGVIGGGREIGLRRGGVGLGGGGCQDVEMEEEEEAEGAGKDVTVYTFGEECVPVCKGIVRRQKQEIESKRSSTHQRSLSTESAGSHEDDGGGGPHFSPPATGGRISEIPAPMEQEEEEEATWAAGGGGGARNIPTSSGGRQLQHGTQPSSLSAEGVGFRQGVPGGIDRDGAFPLTASVTSSSVERGGGRGIGVGVSSQRLATASIASFPDSTTTAGGGNQSHVRTPVHWNRWVSEGSGGDSSAAAASSDITTTTTTSPRLGEEGGGVGGGGEFRPYSHSFPSAGSKRQVVVNKSNFDPQTLALIREMGSAFVVAPPATAAEGQEVEEEDTSLVKHLVKTIEKSSETPAPPSQERKIVILDSSGRQERSPVGTSTPRASEGSSSLLSSQQPPSLSSSSSSATNKPSLDSSSSSASSSLLFKPSLVGLASSSSVIVNKPSSEFSSSSSSSASLFRPSPEFMARHLSESSDTGSVVSVAQTSAADKCHGHNPPSPTATPSTTLTSTSPRSGSVSSSTSASAAAAGAGERSKGELPSVVRHLRDRFESQTPCCGDNSSSEGESAGGGGGGGGTVESSAAAALFSHHPHHHPHHHHGDSSFLLASSSSSTAQHQHQHQHHHQQQQQRLVKAKSVDDGNLSGVGGSSSSSLKHPEGSAVLRPGDRVATGVPSEGGWGGAGSLQQQQEAAPPPPSPSSSLQSHHHHLPHLPNPRRPRSAEHHPPPHHHHTPGLTAEFVSSTTPTTPSQQWGGGGRGGGELEEGGGGCSEGVKVRRLHGKSHPLSRLTQQQQQGAEGSNLQSLPRHSPFHSSM